MAESAQIGGHATGLLGTTRHDTWWIEPLWTGVGFGIFALYATWAAIMGEHYYAEPYLSPFYSPLLFVTDAVAGAGPVSHAWLGAWPSWWPAFIPASPALIILAGPLSFRLSCYYYRKFYYRAYFVSPPACAVGGMARHSYKGETRLFLIQNLHRYTLYIAIFYIAVLYIDAVMAFSKNGKLGVGVGTIVLLLNPTLLLFYTFGCHAFRHMVGGRKDCKTCEDGTAEGSYKVWSLVSKLNENHRLWAWVSMIWVGLTDVYVRLVSMGVIHDYNTW